MECDRSIESSQMFSPSDTNTSAHWGPRLPSPQEPIPPEETLGTLVVGTTRDHLGMPPTHRTPPLMPLSVTLHFAIFRLGEYLWEYVCSDGFHQSVHSIRDQQYSVSNVHRGQHCVSSESLKYHRQRSRSVVVSQRSPADCGTEVPFVKSSCRFIIREYSLGFPSSTLAESYPREATATPPVSSRQWNEQFTNVSVIWIRRSRVFQGLHRARKELACSPPT